MSESVSTVGEVDDPTGIIPTGRLEAFSDGVFAIAATLLVLDISTPDHSAPGRLVHELFSTQLLSEYAGYLVSFLVIGITWMNHHSLFRQIARIDRRLMFLNLLLLMVLSFLPFPTRVMANYLTSNDSNAHAAAFFYSLTMLIASLLFAAIWWHASSDGGRLLTHALDPQTVRNSRRRFGLGTLVYIPALGIAFISAQLTLLLQAAVAVYYAFEQLRTDS